MRVRFLAAQAFSLGLLTALILIPSTAIFLATFGAGLLPVTYIGAAVGGVAASAALTRVLRQRAPASVAETVLTGVAIALLATWALLSIWGAEWVSFALVSIVPIVVPIGFMFVVGQAGMLLDVRALKAAYARVVAGFALGFVAGGLAGPILLAVLGTPENLLAAAAAVAMLFLVLVDTTRRRFPAELDVIEAVEAGARPTMRAIASNRYASLIVAFQMLSAVESQWLDFLLFDRAAERYDTADQLTRFTSQFAALAYGIDIVFLVAIAGLLLRKHGLRYGLTANPAAVFSLVAAVVVVGIVVGSGATIVFALIVAARATDLVFSDGAARTSLSAAYQAVPRTTRLVVQATVEGLAVPLAIGLSGAMLLLLRATVGTEGLVLPVLTAAVVAVWGAVALRLYRDYRVNLLVNLRRHELEPAELLIGDANSLEIIDRMLRSDDDRDVNLALDTLTAADHPELRSRLDHLARAARTPVRIDALRRLAVTDLGAAARVARAMLDDTNPAVRAACLEVLGRVSDPSDLSVVEALATDEDGEVRVAAAAALTGIGDDAVRGKVAQQVAELARGEEQRGRVAAATILGSSSHHPMDRGPLRALIADPDPEVAVAALAAVRWPADAEVVDEIVRRLRDRRTTSAAVDALVRAGEPVLSAADRMLGDEHSDPRIAVQLARVCRLIGGDAAAEVLRRHLRHRDRDVGLAVITALGALVSGPRADPATSELLQEELRHATWILHALVTLAEQRATAPLAAALRDELDLARRRVLALVATVAGGSAVDKVVLQLGQGDPHLQAIALEWLDVTLSGADRATHLLLDPDLSDAERLQAMSSRFTIEAMDQDAVLDDLIADRDDRWRRPWLTACALYTLCELATPSPDLVLSGREHTDDILGETLIELRRRHGVGVA